MHVTREYTSHGVGRQMHEDPHGALTYGKPGTGMLLRPGITIAMSRWCWSARAKRGPADQWTVVSADGSLTAHFEHTVAVTEGEPEILTVP